MGLALLLLVFPTVMPSTVDALLQRVYQPVVEKRWFGLFESEAENPLLVPRRQQVKAVVWVSGISVVLLLLWLHVPRAIGRAENRSRRCESEADERLLSDPSHSLLMYRSALSWTTDPEHESRLRRKVESLNQRLSGLLRSEAGLPGADATMVIEPRIEPTACT